MADGYIYAVLNTVKGELLHQDFRHGCFGVMPDVSFPCEILNNTLECGNTIRCALSYVLQGDMLPVPVG